MKASLVALLAALLCVERGSSLTCFTCDNIDSLWNCQSMEKCSDSDKYCITKYSVGGVGESRNLSISKGCSPFCPEGGTDIGRMAFSVKCCKTSLCNTSGAISMKSSSLMLAVGILASLFYIFETKL